MSKVRTDIKNWWAVEAMTASYNHVYKVIYNTRYEERGSIGVSVYEDAPVAPFHYEFLAFDPSLDAVLDAILKYNVPDGKKYIINVFHPTPSDPGLKEQFTRFNYDFVRTGPIVGLDLPQTVTTIPLNVHKAKTLQHTERLTTASLPKGNGYTCRPCAIKTSTTSLSRRMDRPWAGSSW